MHLLIADDSYDKDFVEKELQFPRARKPKLQPCRAKTISFEEYKQRIAKYTPEYVSELSGISTDQIRMLADLFADRDAANY